MMVRLLCALKGLPDPLPNKHVLADMLKGLGVSTEVVRWIIGMVVKKADRTGYRLNFCVTTALELLADYTQKDCWETLLNSHTDSQIHMVIGSNSQRWDEELRGKLDGAAASGTLKVHQLEKSGHWMHSDEPEAVSELIRTHLEGLAAR
jgi:hypothetical protein